MCAHTRLDCLRTCSSPDVNIRGVYGGTPSFVPPFGLGGTGPNADFRNANEK